MPPERRFAFYDQVHTTGIDIRRASNACAVVTMKEPPEAGTVKQVSRTSTVIMPRPDRSQLVIEDCTEVGFFQADVTDTVHLVFYTDQLKLQQSVQR